MKWCNNVVLDAALNYIKTTANKLTTCSTQPATYTEAVTTNMIAEVVITAADFTGPSDGVISGRKLTVDEQAEIDITNSGDVQHLALVDTIGEVLLYVTTTLTKSVLMNNKLTVPSWNIEIRDPD